MPNIKKSGSSKTNRDIRPALTPEAEENQMISLAFDLAKKQLLEGTASSQVVTHFLKLGSTREKAEREKLQRENELLKAKTKSLASMENIEKLYGQAISAMRKYSGQDVDENEDDEY